MLDFFMDDFYVSNELLNTPLNELEFSVLDFETTGLYPYNGDKIVEIGIVRINYNSELDSTESLINPGMLIPENVSKINHITDEMVKDSPAIEVKIDEISKFIKNSVLCGHNLNFDLSFLNYQLEKMKRKKVDQWLIDTLKISKAVLPNLERYTLGHITKELNINNKETHRALSDARATSKVLMNLIDKIGSHSCLKDLSAFKIQ